MGHNNSNKEYLFAKDSSRDLWMVGEQSIKKGIKTKNYYLGFDGIKNEFTDSDMLNRRHIAKPNFSSTLVYNKDGSLHKQTEFLYPAQAAGDKGVNLFPTRHIETIFDASGRVASVKNRALYNDDVAACFLFKDVTPIAFGRSGNKKVKELYALADAAKADPMLTRGVMFIRRRNLELAGGKVG